MKRLTPYQKLPAAMRIAIWLWWMPPAYVKAVAFVTWWALRGARPFDLGNEETGPWVLSRWASAAMVWNSIVRLADMKMGNYFTLEEVMADLGIEK